MIRRLAYAAGTLAYCLGLWWLSGDIGIAVTGTAATVAFFWSKKRWLPHVLLLSWAVIAFLSWREATMATIVLTMTLSDLLIAGAALVIWIYDTTRADARIIGGLSMLMMPAHWTVSVAQGLPDWTWAIYAGASNAIFVAQCLIVRGWLDGVGRSIHGLFARPVPVRHLRDGDR